MTRALAYVGTYDPGHARNAVLITGLRGAGVTVHEFNVPFRALEAARVATWRGATAVATGVLAAHLRLLARHPRRLDVDTVVVGYPGHFMVPFGRALAAARDARLVFDPLVSLADTFRGDRELLGPRSTLGRAVDLVDRVAFSVGGLVLADTGAQATFYAERFRVPPQRLAVVPVGAPPAPQATGAARDLGPGEPLVVFQYGKWSPLHGAGTVLAAAGLLRDRPLRFVLAGEGQESAALRAEILRRRLINVEWLGMLDPAALRARTLDADVCLGIFGRSDKARRVVPTKVYEALACGRPVVTSDTPAAREVLRDGVDAVLVPPGDAAALAAALVRLADRGVREALGASGLSLYRRAFTPTAVAGRLLSALGRSP